jgi:hypothetical protein
VENQRTNSSYIYRVIITCIIVTTLLFGAAIGVNIMSTKWTKDLIQTSLEKGQNPMYVKCAMESHPSNECKTLITALAVSRSDK